jgi:hypothetical protein
VEVTEEYPEVMGTKPSLKTITTLQVTVEVL